MSRYNYNKFVYEDKHLPVEENCEKEYHEYMKTPKAPENLSIKKEPNVKYTTYENYIKISSGARDTTSYPLHYDYRILFENPFRNIKSIEMVSCVIPNSNISTEPLVIFDITELNYIKFHTPNNGVKKVFATFPISEPSQPGHSFINLKPEGPVLDFKTPLASLSSISVKLYNVDYEPLDFGSTAGSTSKTLQHSFLLKITVVESSKNPVQNRVVLRDQ